MANFDPDVYLSQVQPQKPAFDPDAYLASSAPSLATQEIQPQMGLGDMLFDPQTAQNLRGAIQDVVYSIPGMATQAVKGLYDVAKFKVGTPQQQNEAISDVLGQAVGQGQQMAQDVLSPLGSRESFRGMANLGLMAAPAVGELLGEAALVGEKPPIQARPQIPEGPITDLAEQPIKPEEVNQNAVQEPSTREVLQRQPEEVGATGSERTGVEQSVQGQETPQASTQEVAPAVKSANVPFSGAGAEPTIGAGEGQASPIGRTEGSIPSTGATSQRFVLDQHGRVVDTLYSQTVTHAATDPKISQQALKSLNESDLNGKFINPVTLAADAEGNHVLVSDGLPEPIKISPVSKGGTGIPSTLKPKEVGAVPQPEQTQAAPEPVSPYAPKETAPVPEAEGATTAAPETKPEKVQPGEFGQKGYTAVPTEEGKPEVGISQARTEAELGAGSVEPGVGAEMGSGIEYGRDFINKGGDPRLPIRRAQTSGLVGKNEVGIVHAELERLRGERSNAAKVLESNPEDPVLQKNFEAADNAQRAWRKELQPVLTKASDALREAYAQSTPDIDPSTYQGLADLFDEHFKGQREITPQMRTSMTKAAKGVETVRTQANGEMANIEKQLTNRLKGKKVMTPEELDADLRTELETIFKDCFLGK